MLKRFFTPRRGCGGGEVVPCKSHNLPVTLKVWKFIQKVSGREIFNNFSLMLTNSTPPDLFFQIIWVTLAVVMSCGIGRTSRHTLTINSILNNAFWRLWNNSCIWKYSGKWSICSLEQMLHFPEYLPKYSKPYFNFFLTSFNVFKK